MMRLVLVATLILLSVAAPVLSQGLIEGATEIELDTPVTGSADATFYFTAANIPENAYIVVTLNQTEGGSTTSIELGRCRNFDNFGQTAVDLQCTNNGIESCSVWYPPCASTDAYYFFEVSSTGSAYEAIATIYEPPVQSFDLMFNGTLEANPINRMFFTTSLGTDFREFILEAPLSSSLAFSFDGFAVPSCASSLEAFSSGCTVNDGDSCSSPIPTVCTSGTISISVGYNPSDVGTEFALFHIEFSIPTEEPISVGVNNVTCEISASACVFELPAPSTNAYHFDLSVDTFAIMVSTDFNLYGSETCPIGLNLNPGGQCVMGFGSETCEFDTCASAPVYLTVIFNESEDSPINMIINVTEISFETTELTYGTEASLSPDTVYSLPTVPGNNELLVLTSTDLVNARFQFYPDPFCPSNEHINAGECTTADECVIVIDGCGLTNEMDVFFDVDNAVSSTPSIVPSVEVQFDETVNDVLDLQHVNLFQIPTTPANSIVVAEVEINGADGSNPSLSFAARAATSCSSSSFGGSSVQSRALPFLAGNCIDDDLVTVRSGFGSIDYNVTFRAAPIEETDGNFSATVSIMAPKFYSFSTSSAFRLDLSVDPGDATVTIYADCNRYDELSCTSGDPTCSLEVFAEGTQEYLIVVESESTDDVNATVTITLGDDAVCHEISTPTYCADFVNTTGKLFPFESTFSRDSNAEDFVNELAEVYNCTDVDVLKEIACNYFFPTCAETGFDQESDVACESVCQNVLATECVPLDYCVDQGGCARLPSCPSVSPQTPTSDNQPRTPTEVGAVRAVLSLSALFIIAVAYL